MSPDTKNCTPLLEMATPYLYRRNLFRVLNIPVTATSRDIQRQQNRLKMQEKLGIATQDADVGLFPLEPPPSDQDIRTAMEDKGDVVALLLYGATFCIL